MTERSVKGTLKACNLLLRLAPGGGCMLREGRMSDGIAGINGDVGNEGLFNMSHGTALAWEEKDATCEPAE